MASNSFKALIIFTATHMYGKLTCEKQRPIGIQTQPCSPHPSLPHRYLHGRLSIGVNRALVGPEQYFASSLFDRSSLSVSLHTLYISVSSSVSRKATNGILMYCTTPHVSTFESSSPIGSRLPAGPVSLFDRAALVPQDSAVFRYGASTSV